MRLLYSFFIFIVCIGCSQKKEKTKTQENPIENIKWIKEYIDKTKESPFPTKVIITQYTYNKETVYLVNGCYKCSDEVSYLYNRKNEKLCTFGGMVANSNNCPNFFDKAANKKVLWKSFKE